MSNLEKVLDEITWLNVVRRLDELKPYEFNPRSIKKKEIERLKRSIKESGYNAPILIDTDNTIIAGHQRWHVLKLLGYDQVDVRIASKKLTDKQFQRINIQDNVDFGQFEKDLLKAYFERDDLIEWGVRDDEFYEDDEVLPTSEGLTGDDDVPDEPEEEPKTKPGDLYILGEHRLLCGDATNLTDVERLMGEEKADMLFTDPPYNIGGKSKNYVAKTGLREGKSHEELSNAAWDKDFVIEDALVNIAIVMKQSFTGYIWTSQFLINRIWEFFKDYDTTNYLVWSKTNPMPSLTKKHPTFNTELCAYIAHGKDRTVNFPEEGHFLSCREVAQKNDNRVHPTQKPIELIEPIIEFSSKQRQIVLDLFGGSGSTMIACEKIHRSCYTMEISPKYCDVIVQRWEKFTGNKAELVTVEPE